VEPAWHSLVLTSFKLPVARIVTYCDTVSYSTVVPLSLSVLVQTRVLIVSVQSAYLNAWQCLGLSLPLALRLAARLGLADCCQWHWHWRRPLPLPVAD
jgi:hypothetical protein